MINATILYSPFGTVSSSIVPLEVFYSAGTRWNLCISVVPEPRFSITTATIDGGPVIGGAGVKLTPDKALEEIEETDLVLVPAGGTDLDRLLDANAAMIPWLQKMHKKGALIAGVCTGTAVLAAAGLLDGRRATTHWAVADQYRQRFPKVDWQPQFVVTEDRGVLCGGGVYASIDLALYIVEKLCGRDIAVSVAKALVLQMPRTYQESFSVLPFGSQHADTMIRKAEDWLHNHFPDDVDLDGLAADIGLAPRTFLRRFKAATGETPLAYLQGLRIAAAKRMLEDDRMTIQEVGLAVGYEDLAFFRDLFKRHARISPSAYRERYGPAAEVVA